MAFDLEPLLYCHWRYIAQLERVHTVGLNQKISESAVSLVGLSGNAVLCCLPNRISFPPLTIFS